MISLITAKRLHRELWFWLELNPGKLKHQWPGWKWYEKDLPDKAKYSCCFACLISLSSSSEGCRNCVIKWKGHSCIDEGVGEFALYYDQQTLDGISHYARIIRTLPWKDEDKK